MTIEPNVRALKHGALAAIMDVLNGANDANDFLAAADAIVGSPANQLRLPVDPTTPDELEAGPAGATGRDVGNAPKVYESLGPIDRANASDGRLWTYLAFSTYRSYMEQRWPLNVPSWKRRVKDRWLLTGTTRGRLVRHGIARLWWVADLTYDRNCQHPLSVAFGDPFAYAKATFKNEDRVINLFDREAGAIPHLVRVVLEHAESSPDLGMDQHIRHLMKELTLVYGFRDIEVLGEEGLRELVSSLGEMDPGV
jgi:Family of unknown function (DUF6339)